MTNLFTGILFCFFWCLTDVHSHLLVVPGEAETVYVNDDYESMYEYSTANLYVLNNDYGISDGVLSLRIVDPPKHGKALLVGNDYIQYTPNPGFVGEDRMSYEVCSVHQSCGIGVVDILVRDFDFKPIALNDTVTIVNRRDTVVAVLDNDRDYYDEPWYLQILQGPWHGQAHVVSNTGIHYQPDDGFARADSLQYRVCDADGDCAQAWVLFMNGGSFVFDRFLKLGFSPNGDGINDLLFIKELVGNPKMDFLVYDRAGSVVFSQLNYNNDWNGKANRGVYTGKLLPCGTYLFHLKAEGVAKPLQGYIYVNY